MKRRIFHCCFIETWGSYLAHKNAMFPIPSQLKPVCTHQISRMLLFHLNCIYWFIFVCGKTFIKSPFFVISKHWRSVVRWLDWAGWPQNYCFIPSRAEDVALVPGIRFTPFRWWQGLEYAELHHHSSILLYSVVSENRGSLTFSFYFFCVMCVSTFFYQF